MDKAALGYVVEKTQELINAPTCSKEAKVAAKEWPGSNWNRWRSSADEKVYR